MVGRILCTTTKAPAAFSLNFLSILKVWSLGHQSLLIALPAKIAQDQFPFEISIRWVVSQVFFLCNRAFWLAHHQKKSKTWKAPQWRWNVSPLPHLFREKGELWAKDMKLSKMLLGALLRTTLGTWKTSWKPIENLGNTRIKKCHPHAPPPTGKIIESSWMHVQTSH